MKNSIQHQLSLMFHKKEFSIAFCAVMTFCMAAFILAIVICWGEERFQVLSADSMFLGGGWFPMWPYFQYVFLFLVVVPYSMSYLNDKECEITCYLFTRESRAQYYGSLMAACFIGNFIVIFIPFCINFILCHLAFGRAENTMFAAYETWGYYKRLMGTNFMFPTLYEKIPLLKLYLFSSGWYHFAYLLLLSFIAGVLGVFLLCLSMWGLRSRAILFTPLYLLWLISSVAGEYSYARAASGDGSYFTNWNFMVYFSANGGVGQNPWYFALVLFVLIAFCGVTFLRMTGRDILGVREKKNDQAGKRKTR